MSDNNLWEQQGRISPSWTAAGALIKTIEDKLPSDSLISSNSNVGKKFDAGKLDYTLLPFKALSEVVEVLGFGERKYGRDNWQKVERQRYIAAAFRHLVEIAKGYELDEESGKSHAAHLACCALFLGTPSDDYKVR